VVNFITDDPREIIGPELLEPVTGFAVSVHLADGLDRGDHNVGITGSVFRSFHSDLQFGIVFLKLTLGL
jgi:hypothetical protein